MLDDEEDLARLCPGCRARAMEELCPVCGTPVKETAAGENAAFDWERFEALKRGETG